MKNFIQLLVVVLFSLIYIGCEVGLEEEPVASEIYIDNHYSEDIYVFVIGDGFSKERRVSTYERWVVNVGIIAYNDSKSFEVSAVYDGKVVGSKTIVLEKNIVGFATFSGIDDGFD